MCAYIRDPASSVSNNKIDKNKKNLTSETLLHKLEQHPNFIVAEFLNEIGKPIIVANISKTSTLNMNVEVIKGEIYSDILKLQNPHVGTQEVHDTAQLLLTDNKFDMFNKSLKLFSSELNNSKDLQNIQQEDKINKKSNT